MFIKHYNSLLLILYFYLLFYLILTNWKIDSDENKENVMKKEKKPNTDDGKEDSA